VTAFALGLLLGLTARLPWSRITATLRATAAREWAATARDRADMWAGRPQDGA
jgi:hypothetical protein